MKKIFKMKYLLNSIFCFPHHKFGIKLKIELFEKLKSTEGNWITVEKKNFTKGKLNLKFFAVLFQVKLIYFQFF